MFQIGYLIAAPLIGTFLKNIGRKNCVIVGFSVMVLATIGFGLLDEFENRLAFFSDKI